MLEGRGENRAFFCPVEPDTNCFSILKLR